MSDLKPVKSSNIQAVGYDPKTRTLSVQFLGDESRQKPPRTYHHEDVSEEDYHALLGEGVEWHSVGKHYARHIRGRFAHRMEE